MTNPRDTGRYDAIEQEYIDQQVRVDFAWGNIPMQPNDDRGEDTLAPLLDSHIIAVAGYQNFPSFTPGAPFDDTLLNVTVPNVVGLTEQAAKDAINAVGLNWTRLLDEVGANSGNTGNVKYQTPEEGTILNVEDTVTIGVYNNPMVTVPSVVDFDSVSAAEAYLVDSGLVLGTVTTSTVGATTSNWGWVKSQSPASGTSVAPGTAVNLVSYNYASAATTGSISGFARSAISSLGGSLNGDQAIMYVTGRNTWPAVGSTINVTGSSASQYNVAFTVTQVAADDAYNTGGTAIKVTLVSGNFGGVNTSSGGTWAFPPSATLGPVTNWKINGYGFSANVIFENQADVSAISSNSSGYRLVITGGAKEGTYQIFGASANAGTYVVSVVTSGPPFTLRGSTSTSSSGTVDAGTVAVWPV